MKCRLNRITRCIALVALLPGALLASNVDNLYSIEADGTIDSQFSPGDSDPWDPWGGTPPTSSVYLASTWGYGSPAPATLTASFLADKTFRLSFSAPEAMTYRVSPPATATWSYLYFALNTDSGSHNPYYENSTFISFGFLGATGEVPIFSPYIELSEGWNGVRTMSISLSAPVQESFSFTGFTAEVTLDPAFSHDYDDHQLTSAYVYFDSELAEGAPDPGQWVILEAVPEPSAPALIVMGFALLVLGHRRRRIA